MRIKIFLVFSHLLFCYGCQVSSVLSNKSTELFPLAIIDTVYFSDDTSNLIIESLGKVNSYSLFSFSVPDQIKLNYEKGDHFVIHEFFSCCTSYSNIYYSTRDSLVYCDSIVFTTFPNVERKRREPTKQQHTFRVNKEINRLTSDDLDYDRYTDSIHE